MKTLVLTAAVALLPCGLEAADVKAKIKDIAALPGIKNSSWGLSVKDAANGKVVAERNPRLNLTPASIIKVLVTAAALEKFGPEKTFKTELYHDGTISNGFLNGNVYIKGGGDPSLGSQLIKDAKPLEQVFAQWAAAINQAAGIRFINGAIVADESAFKSVQPGSWAWEDIGNYYAAQPSALTVNDGLYKLFLRPSDTVGGPAAELRTEPAVEGLEFENHMKTGPKGSGDNGYIYAFPGQSRAVLRGTIPQGAPEFVIKGALPDPALFTAQSFALHLARARIVANKKPFKEAAPLSGLTFITGTDSRPLKEIVRVTNKRSFNLYAEILLRHLGGGSPAAGANAVKELLTAAGADASELKMADACGLSWRNMTKAETFTDLLRHVKAQKYFSEFYDSLVYPGDPDATGHVRHMGKGTALEANLRLKSGSLNGVRSYTGYLKTKKGRTLVFTSIMNNYSMNGATADQVHEELLLELYNSY